MTKAKLGQVDYWRIEFSMKLNQLPQSTTAYSGCRGRCGNNDTGGGSRSSERISDEDGDSEAVTRRRWKGDSEVREADNNRLDLKARAVAGEKTMATGGAVEIWIRCEGKDEVVEGSWSRSGSCRWRRAGLVALATVDGEGRGRVVSAVRCYGDEEVCYGLGLGLGLLREGKGRGRWTVHFFNFWFLVRF